MRVSSFFFPSLVIHIALNLYILVQDWSGVTQWHLRRIKWPMACLTAVSACCWHVLCKPNLTLVLSNVQPMYDQSIRIPPQVSGSKMASFLFIVVAADCADVMARPYFSTYFLFKLKTNKRHNNNRLMFTVYIHIYTMLDNNSTVFTSKSCRLQGLSLIYSSLSIGMKWSILINHLTDWRQGKGFPFPFN